jgi:hypothetical protein
MRQSFISRKQILKKNLAHQLRVRSQTCPNSGDGVLHRTIVRVQKMYFDPPDLDGRMPRVSTWGP